MSSAAYNQAHKSNFRCCYAGAILGRFGNKLAAGGAAKRCDRRSPFPEPEVFGHFFKFRDKSMDI